MKSKVFRIIQLGKERSDKRLPNSTRFSVVQYDDSKSIIYLPLKGIVSLVNGEFVKNMYRDDDVVKAFFDYANKAKCIKMENSKILDNYLCLELTKDCNLKCVYCYAHGGDNPKYMSWETAKTAITFQIARCKGKSFLLEFHGGGEPTIAFPMMKRCYEYTKKKCDKKGVKVLLNLTTNGTLVTEDMTKWFKKVHAHMVFSFDGLPEVQNRQRLFRDGGKSYERVKQSLMLLNKYKIKYRVNSTITKNSVSKMREIIKNFHHLGVKYCSFGYVWECGRCSETCSKKPKYSKFDEEMEHIKKLAKRYNIIVEESDVHDLDYVGVDQNIVCGGIGYIFFVNCDGLISSCFAATDPENRGEKEFFFGKIKGGKVIIDEKRLAFIRNRTADNLRICDDCFAKYLCRGYCPLEAARKTGTIYKPAKEDCETNREIARKILINVFRKPIV